jgi:transcriptional regulator with XRE-family HTH domain
MATKLQELREAKGKTRQEVSKATGIPYNTLKRLELRNSDLVNLQTLSTLAAYYNQPLDVRHLLGVQ